MRTTIVRCGSCPWRGPETCRDCSQKYAVKSEEGGAQMRILTDGGGGVTRLSLEFWHEHKDQIGKVISLEASFDPLKTNVVDLIDEGHVAEYNVAIRGELGLMLLSGCCCGYGGEGPNGTAKILVELGVEPEEARQLMVKRHFATTFGKGRENNDRGQ